MRSIAFRRAQIKRIKKQVRKQEMSKVWDLGDMDWVERAIMLRTNTRTICSCPMCKWAKHNDVDRPKYISFKQLIKSEQD